MRPCRAARATYSDSKHLEQCHPSRSPMIVDFPAPLPPTTATSSNIERVALRAKPPTMLP